MIFAGAIFAFMGCFALSVDYARLSAAQTSLQNMTDSAALAAASTAGVSQTKAIQQAYNAFDSQKAKHAISTTRNVVFSTDGIAVTATATAKVEMVFGKVLGTSVMTVSAKSEALQEKGYLDVYQLLDFSSSMGLAATPAEMTRLKGLTKPYTDAAATANPGSWGYLTAENGCAFACHTRDGWEPAGKTALDIARANNVLLRWDVMNTAATLMTKDLLDSNSAPGAKSIIRVGISTFGDTVQNTILPTDSIANPAYTLSNPALLQQNTSLNTAIQTFGTSLGTSGTGASAASPQKVLVIATDGVQTLDRSKPLHQTIDPAVCSAIKAKGITIAVINVKYVRDIASPVFTGRVQPMYDQIEPAMIACASSADLYLTASDATGIKAAFQQMADKISMISPRLTR
jgi:Flp pilus assembly protein TadG